MTQLLLARATWVNEIANLPGSVTIDADCGHRAYLSKEGQAYLASHTATTICTDCMPDAMEEAKKAQAVPGAMAASFEGLDPCDAQRLRAFYDKNQITELPEEG